MIIRTAAALISLAFTLTASGGSIEGTVFIATKDGTAIKLPLVPVELRANEEIVSLVARHNLDIKAAEERIEAARAKLEPQFAGLEENAERAKSTQDADALEASVDAEAKLLGRKQELAYRSKYLNSALSVFDDLYAMPNAPICTCKTDANGHFVMRDARPGKYAVCAQTQRQVAEATYELYCWIVRVDVGESAPVSVSLDNDNLSDSIPVRKEILSTGPNDEDADRGRALELAAEKEWKIKQRGENDARLPALVAASQRRAVLKYPDLGRAGTVINTRFIEMLKKLQVEKSARLDDPDWPEKLADEAAAQKLRDVR